MSQAQTGYAIVLIVPASKRRAERRTELFATDDADAATAAFHSQWAELSAAQRTGELVVLRSRNAARPLLRQPLADLACTPRVESRIVARTPENIRVSVSNGIADPSR
jgi:hypothetical protein